MVVLVLDSGTHTHSSRCMKRRGGEYFHGSVRFVPALFEAFRSDPPLHFSDLDKTEKVQLSTSNESVAGTAIAEKLWPGLCC